MNRINKIKATLIHPDYPVNPVKIILCYFNYFHDVNT